MLVFVGFVPEEKCQNVAPPWCQAKEKSTDDWDHHKIWTDTIAKPILQSWPSTIRLSPVWSFEAQPAKTPVTEWWGIAEGGEAVVAGEWE
jgi:hypothetical protein